MRRSVAVIVMVLTLLLAVAAVQRQMAGRAASGLGTPDPSGCASPVAEVASSPSAVSRSVIPPTGVQPCEGSIAASDTGGAARFQIAMDDFAFIPDEITIPASTDVVIEVTNVGSAEHNLVIGAANNPSDPAIRTDYLASGESATLTVNLPKGEWYFYCEILGHLDLDMEGYMHIQ